MGAQAMAMLAHPHVSCRRRWPGLWLPARQGDLYLRHAVDLAAGIGHVGQLGRVDLQGESNVDAVQAIGGTDYAAATSQLSQQMLSLQAAQQSYASISNLSLFQYLK